MIPVRRMKIKAAPNIIGGISKKVNSSIGVDKNSFLVPSSTPQEFNSNNMPLNTLTFSNDNSKRPFNKVSISDGNLKKENDSSLNCDDGNPISGIENASNNKFDVNLEGKFCSQVPSIENCLNLISEREAVDYSTSDKANLPVLEQNNILQEELINSTLCLGLEPVSSSPTIISEYKEEGKVKRINKCTNKITKFKKRINFPKKSKENISHVSPKELNDKFSIPTKFKFGSKIKKDSIENKFFCERKLQFKQKMKLTNGNLEPTELTLFDYIFHNPSTNPMPQRRQNEKSRSSTSTDDGSATNEIKNRLNRAVEADGITSETLEELRAEEEGLQIIDGEKFIQIPEVEGEINENNDEDDFVEDNTNVEEETPNVLAPQVKLGPDGNLIIDEKSLLIQTTAAKNRDKILNNSEVVEENEDSSHYGKWSKRRKRATEWTKKETARFYKALATVGTDFSLMSTVFAWRTRAELKIKFKKEERINPHLIDTALNDCTQFDFSIFDESDYDPEEDRKESKKAEKAEAQKRKELERKKRQQERNAERQRKKEQIFMDKKRKKRLREICNSRKKRKVNDIPLKIQEDSNESTACSVVIEPQEVICEIVFSSNNKNSNVDEGEIVTFTTNNTFETKEKSLANYKKLQSPGKELQVHYQKQLFPNDKNNKDPLANDDEIMVSNVSLSEESSESFLHVLGINVFEDSRVCSLINQTELSDKNTLEDSTVDILDVSGKIEVVIEPVKSYSNDSEDTVQIAFGTASKTSDLCESLFQANYSTQSKSPTISEDMDVPFETIQSLPIYPAMSQVFLPISCVKKNPDGSQYVEINTAQGLKKLEPVPAIPPLTSNIVVVYSQDPSESGEQVFHVYFVSPVTSKETDHNSEQMEFSSENTSSL